MDFFGTRKVLRLHHNGHTPPILRIGASGQYYTVSSICCDGVRMRVQFHYRRWNPNVVTIYTVSPSELYSLGPMKNTQPGLDVPGMAETFEVEHVEPTRGLEKMVLRHGGRYAVSRVGAEIAYCIMSNLLRLEKVVLVEPSKGGKDLHTLDGRVVIQSRLLTRTQFESASHCAISLKKEMAKLVRKLHEDFHYNQTCEVGYAVLSHLLKRDSVRSIVAKVSNPVLEH